MKGILFSIRRKAHLHRIFVQLHVEAADARVQLTDELTCKHHYSDLEYQSMKGSVPEAMEESVAKSQLQMLLRCPLAALQPSLFQMQNASSTDLGPTV